MSTEDIDLFPGGKFVRPDVTDWPPERIALLDEVERTALAAEQAERDLKEASTEIDAWMNRQLIAKRDIAKLPKITHHDLVRDFTGGTVGAQ